MESKQFNLVKAAAKTADLTNEVEYRDKFFLNLAYLPRPELQKIYKESQTMKMNYTTRIREPEVDNHKFTTKFCERTVRGWRGATPRVFSTLINLDLSEFTEEEKDQEVPFSQDQMVYLVENAYDFDQFLQAYVQNLDNFHPNKDYEEKNSVTSPSGS